MKEYFIAVLGDVEHKAHLGLVEGMTCLHLPNSGNKRSTLWDVPLGISAGCKAPAVSMYAVAAKVYISRADVVCVLVNHKNDGLIDTVGAHLSAVRKGQPIILLDVYAGDEVVAQKSRGRWAAFAEKIGASYMQAEASVAQNAVVGLVRDLDVPTRECVTPSI